MRHIVTWILMSLDGVVEAPETWAGAYFNEEVGQVARSGMDASDAMLLGRRTYEHLAAYWPDRSGTGDPVADHINNTPKFVVSTTLRSVGWRNSTLITGDIVQEITKLKRRPGKNITVLGSATLVRSLLREGLLDELGLLVHPVIIGTGSRLFADGTEQLPLTLVSSRTFSNGVLWITYAPVDR